MSKIVLITGCSTGIGRNLAERLSRSGYTVIATARKMDRLENLPVALKLPLDVTQPETIQQAVGIIIQRFGRIDFLVNNAGYAQVGAIEELSDHQIQQMYDVNVFGLLCMIRAVVPTMRKQNAGRIINLSSIAGKMVTPVNGTYSSTKFAIEAVSDALRLELEPFNIQVILIEPGAIKSNFDQTVHAHGDLITTNSASPYHPLYRKYQQVSDGMRGKEPGLEVVSKVIQHAMESSNPKARYVAGFPFSGRIFLHLGDSVWNFSVRQLFKAA
jgi:NADP-dependent 3-hydroxy acid dehydrogenase YdfG